MNITELRRSRFLGISDVFPSSNDKNTLQGQALSCTICLWYLQDNAPNTIQDPLAAVPAYLSEHYTVIDKIGEGTYGVVYMAKTKDQHPRMLAIKTFKPGKVCTEPAFMT